MCNLLLPQHFRKLGEPDTVVSCPVSANGIVSASTAFPFLPVTVYLRSNGYSTRYVAVCFKTPIWKARHVLHTPLNAMLSVWRLIVSALFLYWPARCHHCHRVCSRLEFHTAWTFEGSRQRRSHKPNNSYKMNELLLFIHRS